MMSAEGIPDENSIFPNQNPSNFHAQDHPGEDDGGSGALLNPVSIGERTQTKNSLSPEKALVHMIKVMMGTGLLSLPLAFKQSGLWAGLVFTPVIGLICVYCMRQLVHSASYICSRQGRESIDYANVARAAVELGPQWMCHRGYVAKQVVNVTVFITQLGFCCVYFVFMADNLKQFFDEVSEVKLSQAAWIAMLLVPMLALCSIRQLSELAPWALATNIIYVITIGIVCQYLFTDPLPSWTLVGIGNITDFPLFFGTVMFAFEGVGAVLPIENRMSEPQYFISSNGVVNTACLLVLAVYVAIGFFGYLKLGNAVLDTVTLNLPQTWFYQVIKLMFVICVMVSYPIQFYVPMERIEKWISRKIDPAKQLYYVYGARYAIVILTCATAELIPHLALFISLVGAFSSTALALVFPPMIDLLIAYAKRELTWRVWLKDGFLLTFALVGCFTGTYASIAQIVAVFGHPQRVDPVPT